MHKLQVNIVGLVFRGHEQKQNSIEELEASQSHDAHEEEDPVEDGHGDEGEDGRHEDAEAGEDRDHEGGDALLPDPEELRLLPGDGGGALLDEGLEVVDGGDGVGGGQDQGHALHTQKDSSGQDILSLAEIVNSYFQAQLEIF